jgi:hypothetical protein
VDSKSAKRDERHLAMPCLVPRATPLASRQGKAFQGGHPERRPGDYTQNHDGCEYEAEDKQ